MALENKLNITDSTELARMEEKISKKKAVELFGNQYLNQYKPGTFQMLAAIHKYLFDEIYDFAGKIRTVNMAKGNFRFAGSDYLLSGTYPEPRRTGNRFCRSYDKQPYGPLCTFFT